jgi:hypothetical protein
MNMMAFAEWMQKQVDRGRQLVEADANPDDQADSIAMMRYFEQQREQVSERGYCEGMCCEHELMITIAGEMVCRRTRQPCPVINLKTITELWGQINNDDRNDITHSAS